VGPLPVIVLSPSVVVNTDFTNVVRPSLTFVHVLAVWAFAQTWVKKYSPFGYAHGVCAETFT
jgi:hypothetical protein